jgi:hypothetical protein
MGDAGKALEGFLGHLILEFGDARCAARPLQVAVHVHGNAARVVAPIFESLESFPQEGDDISLRYGADYATHSTRSLQFMRMLLWA